MTGLCVTHFVVAPSVRDYRIRRALASSNHEIHSTVLIDRPGYDRRFENLGHAASSTAVWRPAAETRLGQAAQRVFGMGVARQRLRGLLSELQTEVIHSHNRAHLAYYAKKFTALPVLHDVSDFYSIFPNEELEGLRRYWNPAVWFDHWRRLHYERFAFENCDALTFNSPQMLEVACERYSIRGAVAVIPNAVPEADLPDEELPKLSNFDGDVHLVFVGHVNSKKLAPLLQIARLGIHMHLYTVQATAFESRLRKACRDLACLHWHGALPYRQLLRELTQYDYGLALWYPGARELFFEVSLPSKLFDYLASGLPVIVGPYRALIDFVESYKCGFVLEDVADLREKLSENYRLGDRRRYTMEFYIPRLIELYQSLV